MTTTRWLRRGDLNVITTTRTATSSTRPLAGKGTKSGVDLASASIDRVAGIYVTNPGGTLQAEVGRDANLIGTDVHSGGDIRIHAGGDIHIDTVTTGGQEDIRWNNKMSRSSLQSQEVGSTISGAGNVALQADGDLSARAAAFEAGDTLRLTAGDKLTLYAGENQSGAQTSHATKSGINYFSLDASSQQTTLARTTLDAQHIELQSGGDTTLGAVEMNADTLDVKAGGKLVFAAQSTTDAASFDLAKGDGAFVSVSGRGHIDETTQYAQLNVGQRPGRHHRADRRA